MNNKDGAMKNDARAAFAKHVIAKESEGRWLLRKPYADGRGFDWTMAAEVISLAGGSLYVGGDIDFVIFSWYSDSADHEAKVRWMGRCSDIDYYVRQKAIIGTGRELVEQYDEDEARASLKWHYEDCVRVGDDALAAKLAELLESGALEDRQALLHELYRAQPDLAADVGGTLGMVPHPRVYYAHAALRRLCDILDERQAALEGLTDAR
jgi:hypothetical protein